MGLADLLDLTDLVVPEDLDHPDLPEGLVVQ
jgi:hypothetical protein